MPKQLSQQEIYRKIDQIASRQANKLATEFVRNARRNGCPKVWLIECPALPNSTAEKKHLFDALVCEKAIALVERRGYSPFVIVSSD